MKDYFIFILCSVFFVQCIKNDKYENIQVITNGNWFAKDTLKFECLVEDSTKNYNVYINIRRGLSYKYSNIWFNVTNKIPNKTLHSNNLEFTLEERTGKPFGRIQGEYVETKLFLYKNVKMPRGNHVFYISHLMRDTPLNNVVNIGLGIESTK